MNTLADIAPPPDLRREDKQIVFEHLFRHLAVYTNTARLYAVGESCEIKFSEQIDIWANDLLKNAWAACDESDKGEQSIFFDITHSH